MEKPSILIYGGTVVTMNNEGEIYSPGFIYIEDGYIRGIGRIEDIEEDYKSAELIYKTRGRIIFPGYVNMHTHLSLYPIRMLTPNTTLDYWVENYAWKYERKLAEKLSYYASKLSLYSLMKKGVIGVVDMHFNMEEVARAVEEAGIYANLSVAIMNRGVFEDFKEGLEENLRLIKNIEGNDRITASLGPCSLRLLEREELEEISDLSRKLNVPIHVHVSEVREDVLHVRERYKKLPVELLEEVGLLNDKTILAHCTWCTQRELYKIKKKNSKVAFCPSTNLHMNSGIPPIIEAYKLNINYGFGTDVSPSQEILEEVSIAYYYFRIADMRIPAYTLLKSLSRGESLFLQKEVGVLKVNSPATLVVLKANEPEGWNPLSSRIYEQLLFGKIPVETMIVDGEVLIDGGENLVIPDYEVEEAKGNLEELISSLDFK